MDATDDRSSDPVVACYREVLRNGSAPLWTNGFGDEIDRFTEGVVALAATDGLTIERLWDAVCHGNIADLCPVLVTGRYGEAYWAARKRHGITEE